MRIEISIDIDAWQEGSPGDERRYRNLAREAGEAMLRLIGHNAWSGTVEREARGAGPIGVLALGRGHRPDVRTIATAEGKFEIVPSPRADEAA